MWYVKHPFDCIVVGGLVLSEMAGATQLGVRQPDCRVRGASSRTQPLGY